MGDWRRHAIYFAPPGDHPLATFAAGWLGWDPAAGTEPPAPDLAGLPRPRADLTATPRRYGFHATLKPPFRLAEGTDAAALDADAAALAAGLAPFALALTLAEIGDFLALVPATATAEAAALADACVTGLDRFRAAPSPQDLARRRAGGLDAEEEANLRAWGYPYVGSRFRFHMTLTGALAAADRAATRAALAPALAPLLVAPLPVTEICRFAEAPDGRFHLRRRFRLRAAAATGHPA